ncbi:hypothetical protein PROFUN_07578 [Planoprotostelium fungivorum]|uniref:Protein kinase domain-containing protein n=1 Tax=Planoprotostelium fungivorum TaxID=1890364 RepID=A0A2P6NLT6_9EUKA|nr:hypothetical protein PROFUN_07578 [Planoprotostelium fungivorum]
MTTARTRGRSIKQLLRGPSQALCSSSLSLRVDLPTRSSSGDSDKLVRDMSSPQLIRLPRSQSDLTSPSENSETPKLDGDCISSAPASPRVQPLDPSRMNNSGGSVYVIPSPKEYGLTNHQLYNPSPEGERDNQDVPLANFGFVSICKDDTNTYTMDRSDTPDEVMRSMTPDYMMELINAGMREDGSEMSFYSDGTHQSRSASATPVERELPMRRSQSVTPPTDNGLRDGEPPLLILAPHSISPEAVIPQPTKKTSWFGSSKRESKAIHQPQTPPKKEGGFKGWKLLRSKSPKEEEKKGNEASAKKKEEDARKGRQIQRTNLRGHLLDVNTYEEIPKELRKLIKEAKITPEEAERNLMCCLSALSFQTKVKFQLVETTKKKNKSTPPSHLVKPEPKRGTIKPEINLDRILAKGDPREIYRLHQETGKGGFGRVYRATEKKAEEKDRRKVGSSQFGWYAVKVVDNDTETDRKWNGSEFGLLRYCSHPNIVQFVDCYQVDDGLWGVMEFMEGGPLDLAVRGHTFTEPQIAYIAREITQGLVYLHSEGIMHRDLKSSNIMVSVKGDIKLIDFGLACMVNQFPTSMVGSPFWVPPEMIQRIPYDCKVDIWSLGVCLMELANGKPPHSKLALRALFTSGAYGYNEPFDKPKAWSPAFKDFMSICLKHNPAERASAVTLLNVSR